MHPKSFGAKHFNSQGACIGHIYIKDAHITVIFYNSTYIKSAGTKDTSTKNTDTKSTYIKDIYI